MGDDVFTKFGWEVFASYTHRDERSVVAAMAALRPHLDRLGLTCFFDREDRPLDHQGGLGAALSEGVASARLLVVFLSEAYLGRPWCLAETNGFFRSQEHAAVGEAFEEVAYPALPFNETFLPVVLASNETDAARLVAAFVQRAREDAPFLPGLAASLDWSCPQVVRVDDVNRAEAMADVAEIVADRIARSRKALREAFGDDAALMDRLDPDVLWDFVFQEAYPCASPWTRAIAASGILSQLDADREALTTAPGALTEPAENALVALLDAIARRDSMIRVLDFQARTVQILAEHNPEQVVSSGPHGTICVIDDDHRSLDEGDRHALTGMRVTPLVGNPLLLLLKLAREGNIIEALQASWYQHVLMRGHVPLVAAATLAAIVVSDDTWSGDIYSEERLLEDVVAPLSALQPLDL